MLIRGEALIGTVTVAFAVSGRRNEWMVSITSPGGVTKSGETVEKDWAPLLNEMLADAHDDAIRRRFPERTTLAASNGAKR